MSGAVEKSALDGITIKTLAKGEAFTASCDSSGNVTLDSNERSATICKTVPELDHCIREGQFYIPDHGEWQAALEVMGAWE